MLIQKEQTELLEQFMIKKRPDQSIALQTYHNIHFILPYFHISLMYLGPPPGYITVMNSAP